MGPFYLSNCQESHYFWDPDYSLLVKYFTEQFSPISGELELKEESSLKTGTILSVWQTEVKSAAVPLEIKKKKKDYNTGKQIKLTNKNHTQNQDPVPKHPNENKCMRASTSS